MVTSVVSLSNIIQASIVPAPGGLAIPNVNVLAWITKDQPSWAASQPFAIYRDPNTPAVDFGSASNTALALTQLFAQQPNLLAGGGYVVAIPRLTIASIKAFVAVQDVTYQAVATGAGGNSITVAYTTGGVAGAEVVTVVSNAISVKIATGVSTAAQVAAAVNAFPAAAALVSAFVSGNLSNPQTAPVSAVNLASGGTAGTETVRDAIIRTSPLVSYFGILVADDDYESTQGILFSIASYVQAANKMLIYAASHAADIQPSGLGDLVRQYNYTNTRVLYHSTSSMLFAAAYAGRAFSTNWSGSRTAQTMNLKQLVGVPTDTAINDTTLAAALLSGVDVYGNVVGQINEVLCSGANTFFDQVYGQMALLFALQTQGFNYLAQTATKIPQTDDGMEGLANAYRAVVNQFKTNGYVAPGSWTSGVTFGNVADLIRCVADTGYYVYFLPVSQQSSSDRNARKAPLVQIAVKLAGAVHSSAVYGFLNQ